VALTSSNAAASVPSSVIVPAGTTSATFTVTPTPVSSKQTGAVTASYGGVSKSSTLTLMPIGVLRLELTPNPVTGPNAVTGTITLSCPASTGGLVVKLSTNYSAVARPKVSTVTIPAGSTTGTFTISTADVSKISYATITAGVNGIAKSVKLTVNERPGFESWETGASTEEARPFLHTRLPSAGALHNTFINHRHASTLLWKSQCE
jgi:hypothetical protein